MRFWKTAACDLAQSWREIPDYAEQLVFTQGRFVPNNVYADYRYECVFRVAGAWYVHAEGCWRHGSGFNGGAYTWLLEGVTDENVGMAVEELRNMAQ